MIIRKYYKDDALLRSQEGLEKVNKYIGMIEKFPIQIPLLLHLENK